MAEVGELLAALARLAVVPLVGYAVVRLARWRPRRAAAVLLAVVAAGVAALAYAKVDGFTVRPDTRAIDFASEAGRWSYTVGGVVTVLAVPALPLVAVARARNGDVTGPVGGQWVVVL